MSEHLLSVLETQIQSQEQLLRERAADLEQLRRNHEKLAELARQKDDLLGQLRAVENDIALLERTMSSALTKLGAAPAAAEPAAPESVAEPPADGKASVRETIRKVLKAARQPLTGAEVAARVLAGGYKTTSKDFPNVVKTALADMDDVQNVRGQGYRLKK